MAWMPSRTYPWTFLVPMSGISMVGTSPIGWSIESGPAGLLTFTKRWAVSSSFDINRVTRRIAGRTLESYYAEWSKALIAQSNREANEIRAAGQTSITLLTQSGRTHSNLRFLNDGTLLSIDTVRDETAIYARTPKQKGYESSVPFLMEENITEFDVCPNNDFIVYGRSMKIRGAYRYNDLYSYNRKLKTVRRLTHGARLREPFCSSDSRRVLAAQVFAGGTRLVQGGPEKWQTQGHILTRKSGTNRFPSIHPNGHDIVFTQIGPRFGRDLVHLDTRTGKTDV